MSEASRCPYCGGPQGAASALDSLYREVHKIREIAEARGASAAGGTGGAAGAGQTGGAAGAGQTGGAARAGESERRIAALTREVAELRATVARLRGAGVAGLAPSR